MESLLALVADVGLGAAALALAKTARDLSKAAIKQNSSQDDRINKLVAVAENHEARIEAVEGKAA